MTARLGLLATTLLTVAACAGVPEARLQPPPGPPPALTATLPFQGGRHGAFALPQALGGGSVRFERGADRWTLFDRLQVDRAALRLQVRGGDGPDRDWQCRLRRTEATVGVLQAPLQPPALDCRTDDGARLWLEERTLATRREHVGEYRDGALHLTVRSVHRLAGSPLPLAEPSGYGVEQSGRPVAQVDLLGVSPRVSAGALDATLRPAVRDLAVLLGLSWDPARGP